MVRLVITFVTALMVSTTAWAGNWNQSKDPGHTAQTGTVNIIIPDDVMTAFQNAAPSVKAKHCSAKNDYPYQELAQLAAKPPKRLFGYNSRMDNGKDVEGALEADLFVLRLAEAYTDSWVSGSDEKRQKVMNALYAWAKSDALTKTKPCVKNGLLLDSCTEW